MVLMDLKRATGRMPFVDMEWVQVRAHSRRSNCSFEKITPGAGGRGVFTKQPYFRGGGGGGGILLNGNGPIAEGGTSPIAGGFGGNGFGGGGGPGGYLFRDNKNGQGREYLLYAGGRGAEGLVYIEW